jgi:hypothetical protein
MNNNWAYCRRPRANVAVWVAVCALALAGCSGVGDILGTNKSSPDEFEVVRHAGLAVPPNFELRPPEPGAPRPQEVAPREQARRTLLGATATQAAAPTATPLTAATMPVTPGERALMGAAGANEAPINIREVVRIEGASQGIQDRTLTDTLLFWREPEQADETLDARAEAERLRREKEEGSPTLVRTGQEGLVIKRKKGGILGDLF